MAFIRINNRKNFLIDKVLEFHPASLKYLRYWKLHKKRVIEGFWSADDTDVSINVNNEIRYDKINSNKWRWMPPNLYFYSNFGTIEHTPEGRGRTAAAIKMRPYLRDVEWEIFYNVIEARGFSGFEGDEEYTCCRDLVDKNISEEEYPESCFNKEGKVKKYITAREYLRKLHDKSLGRAYYDNQAKSLMVLASRGVGKSFTIGVGVILHELITDGRKYYDNSEIPKVEIFVGSGMANKSFDLMRKVDRAMRNLAGSVEIGEKYIPSPLAKKMSGSIRPNSDWIHLYDKKIGGTWQKAGTESYVKHKPFTVEDPEAAAGGRYTVIVVEECGLTPNVLSIHASNEAAQTRDTKMGSSFYIGTGGNIEKIVESEILFRDPESYGMLAFDDEWENTGKIGMFIPAIYRDNTFKDENGNTDIERATKYYERRRSDKKKAKTSSALEGEMMNYPLKPSEMFINANSNKFPVSDLKHVLSLLLTTDSIMNASWKGEFYMEEDKRVSFRSAPVKPIIEFPLTKATANIEGCWEIFEQPKKDGNGDIASNRYIASLDPVDDDENDNISRSLQCCIIFDTWTNKIVAEYTGRTKYAKKFYEQCRRGLIYYNSRLLYENQKQGVYSHFNNQNSVYLMIDTPDYIKQVDDTRQRIGNKAKGVFMSKALINHGIDLAVQWLEDERKGEGEDTARLNLHTIRSVGLLRELINYNGEINTDRVSSLLVLMIYRESLVKYREAAKAKVKTKAQDKFFNRHYRKRYTQKQLLQSINDNFKN